MNTTTKRKQSTIAMFVKAGGFPAMRSTFEAHGWLTDGRMMFRPTEAIKKKMLTLASYKSMDPKCKAAKVQWFIDNASVGLSGADLERIDSEFEDPVFGDNHNYRPLRGVKGNLQWSGGFVDFVAEMYPDRQAYTCGTLLVFKNDDGIVAIIQGIVPK